MAYFEYTGKTSLTVVGGVSRTMYRFEGSGARAMVDRRDVPSLSRILVLARIY